MTLSAYYSMQIRPLHRTCKGIAALQSQKKIAGLHSVPSLKAELCSYAAITDRKQNCIGSSLKHGCQDDQQTHDNTRGAGRLCAGDKQVGLKLKHNTVLSVYH